MINHKKIDKNCILNLLTGLVSKKGNNNMAKNLLIYFSKNIFKKSNNIGFYDLFENIIKNAIFPLKVIKKRKKYSYTHRTNRQSIFNFINGIITRLKNNKKRISFDFYFKNEIYKLLNNLENIDKSKQDIIEILLNNPHVSTTVKNNNFNENKAVKHVIFKKHKINIIYKIINIYHYIKKPFIYFGTLNKTFLINDTNIILETTNLNSLQYI